MDSKPYDRETLYRSWEMLFRLVNEELVRRGMPPMPGDGEDGENGEDGPPQAGGGETPPPAPAQSPAQVPHEGGEGGNR